MPENPLMFKLDMRQFLTSIESTVGAGFKPAPTPSFWSKTLMVWAVLPILLTVGSVFLPTAVLAQITGGDRIFEDVRLGPLGPTPPITVKGISGGPLAARRLTEQDTTATGPCIGFIDQEPDHRLTLDAFFDYLSLSVRSPEDTTLVLIGPGGLWCSDDYEGRNPGLAGAWLPGTYEIWVGSYRKETYHPYILEFHTEP